VYFSDDQEVGARTRRSEFRSAMSVYQEASDRYIQRVSQTDPAVSKTGEDSHALS